MTLIETWWAWISFGVVLAILEMVAPAFFFLGFGLGAVATGVILLFGVTMTVQNTFLTFAILSLISWFVVKRLFRHQTTAPKTFDHDINDNT